MVLHVGEPTFDAARVCSVYTDVLERGQTSRDTHRICYESEPGTNTASDVECHGSRKHSFSVQRARRNERECSGKYDGRSGCSVLATTRRNWSSSRKSCHVRIDHERSNNTKPEQHTVCRCFRNSSGHHKQQRRHARSDKHLARQFLVSNLTNHAHEISRFHMYPLVRSAERVEFHKLSHERVCQV